MQVPEKWLGSLFSLKLYRLGTENQVLSGTKLNINRFGEGKRQLKMKNEVTDPEFGGKLASCGARQGAA